MRRGTPGTGEDPGRRRRPDVAVEAGPPGLCPEAQADGVPCTEMGKPCEVCDAAVQDAPWRRPGRRGR